MHGLRGGGCVNVGIIVASWCQSSQSNAGTDLFQRHSCVKFREKGWSAWVLSWAFRYQLGAELLLFTEFCFVPRLDAGAERQLQAPEDQPQASGHCASAAPWAHPWRLHPSPICDGCDQASADRAHHGPGGEHTVWVSAFISRHWLGSWVGSHSQVFAGLFFTVCVSWGSVCLVWDLVGEAGMSVVCLKRMKSWRMLDLHAFDVQNKHKSTRVII